MEGYKFTTGSDSPFIQLITSILNANGQPLLLCSYDPKVLNYELESSWAVVELANKAFYQFLGCKLGEELLRIDSPLLREAVRQSSQRNEEITTTVQVEAKSSFLQICITVRTFSRGNLLISFDTNTINHTPSSYKCQNCGVETSNGWSSWAESIPHFIFTSSSDGEVDFFNTAWYGISEHS